MLPRRTWLLSVLACALLPAAVQSAEPADAGLRVMSFNIRYGTANDGENRWDARRDFVVRTVREFDPDLLGTQETLGFQRDYLAEQLSQYEPFGVGRDDGGDKGEMTALFYRRERFERLEGGHFWLSETPNVPGSVSWDSSLTRICSWVKLRDRNLPTDSADSIVWFFNTHFDHRGQQARIESARLLRRQILEKCGTDRVVVTGDFNTDEGSEPYTVLFAPVEGENSAALSLIDTYRRRHPERGEEEVTFNTFNPNARSGARIDWIAQRGYEVDAAEIVHTTYEGRTPSDHWPITATLSPPACN